MQFGGLAINQRARGVPFYITIEQIMRPRGEEAIGVILELHEEDERSIPVLDRWAVARWMKGGLNEIRAAQMEPRM